MGDYFSGKGKEVIDFWVSRGESQQAWEGFLNDLYDRRAEMCSAASARWTAMPSRKTSSRSTMHQA